MDDINQLQQPNIPTPQEPKYHSFLTNKLFLITLIIVVLFTIIYAGIYLYLGSQSDKISKSSPPPLPAETSVKEGDSTANWKTYTNDVLGFSFSYPEHYLIFEETNQTVSLTYEGTDGYAIRISKDTKDWLNYKLYKSCSVTPSLDCIESGKPWGQQEDIFETQIGNIKIMSLYIKRGGAPVHIVLTETSPIILAEAYVREGKNDLYFNQILSTFKFLDQEDQVFCTQEARQCQDGSYVSRQPPNCEFAACPQK